MNTNKKKIRDMNIEEFQEIVDKTLNKSKNGFPFSLRPSQERMMKIFAHNREQIELYKK